MDWKDILTAKYGAAAPDGASSPDAAKAETEAEATPAPAPTPQRSRLRIELDRKGRKGKPVTLVSEFHGDEAELVRLTKLLQSRLGAGGSHCFNADEPYDGQILIQGDCRTKAAALLEAEGYRTRIVGQ